MLGDTGSGCSAAGCGLGEMPDGAVCSRAFVVPEAPMFSFPQRPPQRGVMGAGAFPQLASQQSMETQGMGRGTGWASRSGLGQGRGSASNMCHGGAHHIPPVLATFEPSA